RVLFRSQIPAQRGGGAGGSRQTGTGRRTRPSWRTRPPSSSGAVPPPFGPCAGRGSALHTPVPIWRIAFWVRALHDAGRFKRQGKQGGYAFRCELDALLLAQGAVAARVNEARCDEQLLRPLDLPGIARLFRRAPPLEIDVAALLPVGVVFAAIRHGGGNGDDLVAGQKLVVGARKGPDLIVAHSCSPW